MMRWPGATVVPIKVVSCGLSPTPVLEFVLEVGKECGPSILQTSEL